MAGDRWDDGGVDAPAVAPTDPSLRDAVEVASDLGVDPERGLTSAEAAGRLRRDGANQLLARPPVPLWRKILAQFQDPLIYLLLFALVISVIAWAAEGTAGLPVDALVIAGVLLANAVIGFVQETRAEGAVAALQSMTQVTSAVQRDGMLRTVPSRDLVRGDILVLAEGDAVGADARLLVASGLRISEASLTGESVAVTKHAAALPVLVPLVDRTDMVYRGTAVVEGVGRAVVTGTGMNTEMGAIAELLEATTEEPSPLQRELAAVSKLLGLTVIAIAVLVMVVTALVSQASTLSQFVAVLLLGVSLAVAAVPEGLPAILSVVLAIGVQRMARRNAVVKKLASVETLGSATVIASDKTGTLTKNEMTIQRIRSASGEVHLTGVGYRPDGAALAGRTKLTDPQLTREATMVLGVGSLASNAQLACRDDEWEIHGDPTEAAFLVAAHKLEGNLERTRGFVRHAEVPFSSERKMMSALVEGMPLGPDTATLMLVAKGAPEVLMPRCCALQVGEVVVAFDDARRAAAAAAADELSALALRTIAVAYRPLHGARRELCADDEQNLIYLGVVGIIDPPRDGVAEAVAQAHRAGVRVVMITGDHRATAARIAEELGIVDPGPSRRTFDRLRGRMAEARHATGSARNPPLIFQSARPTVSHRGGDPRSGMDADRFHPL